MPKKKASKTKKPTPKAKKKAPKIVKSGGKPRVPSRAIAFSGGAPGQTTVKVSGNMSSGDLYVVKIDKTKVPIVNDQGSLTVAAGTHWLTTDLVGDAGATVTVTATVNGTQVASCTCTVTAASQPPRHAACADDFTT